MTRDFNTVVAHFGSAAVPGHIKALEGGRGMMRVSLDEATPELGEGTECVLEMHDGARFRFTVTERLGGEGNELRMKLLGKA
ncbi:hypothetical protein DAETH_04520 [Deinococcus aetherius]|uniref:Uncharacterized protein n=1 Tax=Deinococcus aetherius TaxID=200252 RepID=A0ABM8AA03_9DEIO|nr:hypothetical protein [Deinococcus aetherius]BDP40483.1 hypothetical protein DAETH_04520 [Deinococcus aetherius]